jgi:hypothetical protein
MYYTAALPRLNSLFTAHLQHTVLYLLACTCLIDSTLFLSTFSCWLWTGCLCTLYVINVPETSALFHTVQDDAKSFSFIQECSCSYECLFEALSTMHVHLPSHQLVSLEAGWWEDLMPSDDFTASTRMTVWIGAAYPLFEGYIKFACFQVVSLEAGWCGGLDALRWHHS